MRKIKLSKTPFLTLFLGTAVIVLGHDVTPLPAPDTTLPAPGSSVTRPAFSLPGQAASGLIVAPEAPEILPESSPSVVINTTVETKTSPKHPNLPDYPHAQYEYRTLSLPDGPLYPMQPFFDRISAAAGWDAVTANAYSDATIAVIDTGFALNHESLTTRWATNPNETEGGLTDADGDGYIGNWRGWDFVHNLPDPIAGRTDPAGESVAHGTRTAGLAGLMNPDAQLMPLQALDDNGTGYTDDVAAAVRYAADHGAKIISLSLGTSYDDPYLHAQIQYAVSLGAVVVAASGNDGCDCLLYPAAYPEVVAVGASTSTDTRASFSSYGENLDVMAPGTGGDFCTTDFSAANALDGYGCGYNGTSFSTPIVAGLASLLVRTCPGCSTVDIVTALSLGTDQLAQANGAFYSPVTGYGRINVARSLTLLSTPAATPLGQLVSKRGLSLSSPSLQDGPQMDSTCVGSPGAVCSLYFEGPDGTTIYGGQQVLDYQFGGAVFYWSASGIGLFPGQWKVTTVITQNGTSETSLADLIIVTP